MVDAFAAGDGAEVVTVDDGVGAGVPAVAAAAETVGAGEDDDHVYDFAEVAGGAAAGRAGAWAHAVDARRGRSRSAATRFMRRYFPIACAWARMRTRSSYWPFLSLRKSPPMFESSHSLKATTSLSSVGTSTEKRERCVER